MDVSVETLEGLDRKVTIAVPAAEVTTKINNRVKELSKTAWVEGFRAGKVPERVIRNKFGKAIDEEVINKVVSDSVQSALEDQDFKLASRPEVSNAPFLAGQPLEISATFQVMPEFDLIDLSSVAVEQLETEIVASDVDETLEKLRHQHVEWELVLRPSADGDQIVIDFSGQVGEEDLTNGEASDFDLVLGSQTMIPGFEAGLVGKTAGEKVTLALTFPEEYFKKEIAGKEAIFKITVKAVKAQKLPELNDAFAEKLGVDAGGLEKLRENIRKNLLRDAEQLIKDKTREALSEALLARYNFEVPKALIKQEQLRLQKTALEQFKQMMEHKQDFNNLPSVPKDMYEAEASKRVKSGILFSRYVEHFEIKADAARVKATIQKIAESYQHPEQVINYYYGTPERLDEVQSLVIEEQVIEKILSACQVKRVNKTYFDLAKHEDVVNEEKETKDDNK